jgi:HSP20 family protein
MSTESKMVKTKEPQTLAPKAGPGWISQMERDFDRMLEEFWRRPLGGLWWPRHLRHAEGVSISQPVVDVFDEKDDIVVKAELPGLSKDQIEVNLTGTTLTISGEKNKEEEIKEKDYYYCERSQGSFSRSVVLPSEVKTDQVKASMKDGVLEIRLPKTEEAKKKTVSVTIS